jgi:hypothetical protein
MKQCDPSKTNETQNTPAEKNHVLISSSICIINIINMSTTTIPRTFLLASIFLLLALTSSSVVVVKADVAVHVEIQPSSSVSTSSSTTPVAKCSKAFGQDLVSHLTTMVVDATRQTAMLSDFSLTSEMQLTSFYEESRRQVRRRLPILTTASSKALFVNQDEARNNKFMCHTTCNSSGCREVCGTGTCKTCSSGRGRHRRAMMDWNHVGDQVTSLVTPLLQSYVLEHTEAANGCMGDPDLLHIQVTFLQLP